MNFNDSTPRAQVTIKGQTFSVIQPFAEGHTCTAGEASSLNQTVKENVRNNLAAREGLTQEQVDAYLAAYEMGAVGARQPRVTDPVERRARQIAKSAIDAKLRERGITMDKETLAERVAELAQRPQVRKEAERQIRAEQAGALSGLDDLLGDAGEAPQAAEAA